MVELDVEARQGDSGGPIFNQSGELAGVLFGAGEGTTLGSFAPRVRYFLAIAVPDFEQSTTQAIAAADRPAPNVHPARRRTTCRRRLPATRVRLGRRQALPTQANRASNTKPQVQLAGVGPSAESPHADSGWHSLATTGWYDPLKTFLAASDSPRSRYGCSRQFDSRLAHRAAESPHVD